MSAGAYQYHGMSGSEQVPLLRGEQQPPSSQYVEPSAQSTDGTGTGTTGEDTFEQHSQPSARAAGATVSCRVCDATIELDGKGSQHVIKCAHCHEATPIRPAPAGKKYVRCPCNCLLICKASSIRIACPRANCKRVITLGQSAHSSSTAVRAPAGTCRVLCAYCHEVFMYNTLSNSLARCPHCTRNTSVGRAFARSRSLAYLAASAVALLLCVLLIVLTRGFSSAHPSLYLSWLSAAAFTLYLFYKFAIFFFVKVSTVMGPI